MIFCVYKSISNFLFYWYFRYLMVTELYMVERWERNVMNVMFVIFFLMLSYFNYTVVLNFISSTLSAFPDVLFNYSRSF